MDGQPILPSLKSADTPFQATTFISGGGPVGMILALGLARLGGKVILAEQNPIKTSQANTSFDGRILALTYGTKLGLEKLGIWSSLRAYTTEINHIHVSQKGYLGLTKIHADEMQVPALGYSISGQNLGKVLTQLVLENEQITLLSPAKLTQLEMTENHALVTVVDANEMPSEFQVDVVVGADGTQSTVRQLLNLDIEVKDYHAYGIIAKIETEQSPNHWAFERFTEEGPVALLPMGGHASKAVLVCPEEDLDRIKAMDDQAFIQLFADKMGERLGAFTSISERVYYPLKETYVPNMTQGRAVLMGNASHTQHPVAAQGLNLGIADIEAFLDKIEQTPQDYGANTFLSQYAEARQAHHQKIMGLTDGLIQVFQKPSPVVGHLRGIGLMALQALPPLKRRFSKLSMGVLK